MAKSFGLVTNAVIMHQRKLYKMKQILQDKE